MVSFPAASNNDCLVCLLFSEVFLLVCFFLSLLLSTTKTSIVGYTDSRFFSDSGALPGVGKAKTSTGLVGLAVDHEAVSKIVIKYTALLQKAQLMPPTAQYRINIEKICNHRIKAATQFPDDPEKVEDLCNCGQVEELVQQADDEMEVMEMYLKNKWWEQVKPVDVDTQPNQSEDGGHGDVEWDAKA